MRRPHRGRPGAGVRCRSAPATGAWASSEPNPRRPASTASAAARGTASRRSANASPLRPTACLSVVGTVTRQQTIRINQGYQVDSKWEAIALTGRGVRRAAAVLWRWRTELWLVLAVVLVRLVAGRHMPALAAWLVTLSAIAAAFGWPWSRTLITGRLACARARRRLLA